MLDCLGTPANTDEVSTDALCHGFPVCSEKGQSQIAQSEQSHLVTSFLYGWHLCVQSWALFSICPAMIVGSAVPHLHAGCNPVAQIWESSVFSKRAGTKGSIWSVMKNISLCPGSDHRGCMSDVCWLYLMFMWRRLPPLQGLHCLGRLWAGYSHPFLRDR